MKKTLIALSLAYTFQIIAQEPSNDLNCCTPEPKKCIDCECYTPPYYNLQCDCGVFVAVDFLYWFGKETGLIYALKNETVELSPVFIGNNNVAPFQVAPRTFKWMEESWDPGVRVGLGFSESRDGWDLFFTWTYFHTEKRQSISVKDNFSLSANNFPLEESLISPWVTPELSPGTSNVLDFFNVIKAKWRLNFNVFDLELGRNYWLSPCFSMRPYIGLRGGWTKTLFTNQPILDLIVGPTEIFGIHDIPFTNHFWGAGLLGGFQPNWHFGCGFSLFGNADLALLWGRFESKRKETAIITITSPSTSLDEREPLGESKSEFSQMQAIIDLGIGLRWESTYCCDRYRFALDLGWEHHIWFDHNHRMQLRGQFEQDNVVGSQNGVSFVDFDETYGNLTLAGLTVRARFEF
ncbi:MAG: hypothetical protein K1000chlam2_01517 [Chlamydiae bacterium]|nr:hypothetical protein [Chlamydiota bacterium]